MHKRFTEWNTKKIEVNKIDTSNLYFREREIWWCALGANVGFEQDGKGEEFRRPVLILKKFNRFVVLVVPLTTRIKVHKYYIPCGVSDTSDTIQRMAIISQIRLVDTKRFIDKLGVADSGSFSTIKNAIKALL